MYSVFEPFARFSRLRKIELLLYLAVWTSAVAYAAYNFFLFCQNYRNYLQHASHLYRSWLYQTSVQDRGDFEWGYWKSSNYLCVPLLILRTLLYRFCAVPSHLLLLFDLTACTITIGLHGTLFQIGLSGLFFFVALANQPFLVWILAIAICFLRYVYPGHDVLSSMDIYDHYRVECSTCYLVVRCISFAYDYSSNIERMEGQPLRKTLFQFLRYAFFLPLMWVGPIVPFYEFSEKAENPKRIPRNEFLLFVHRIVTSAILFELMSHFLYPFSVRYLIGRLHGTMSRWALAGICYALGQFFQLKYMALFGLFSFFSKLNGVDSVQFPICVTWTHRYSLMWKYFDHGLYVFLRQYIYLPFAKRRLGKLVSSLGCYMFVLFWHGVTLHMFCWVGLNWIALYLETTLYEKVNHFRLRALLNAPIFAISVVSNMFFLGESYDFGYEVLTRLLVFNHPLSIAGILFALYCCSAIGDVFEVMKYRRKTFAAEVPDHTAIEDEQGAGDTAVNEKKPKRRTDEMPAKS
ncbi:protein-cysteine N-palmitoyltransferase HHAT-like [Paramacrobiotus metropolitanus]|uniref:protein-cysteine N-palmitoyltransferase HHAT-like n=1 Tax=Paramacrobiotus metropolitanus TaxID=2943436 RepID=UPI0024465C01|nr:protein-cysteine N-palmitoyltransferase HHAT-like [Paramacrobiotus metropolitanus]